MTPRVRPDLARLADMLGRPPLTRFAPSPTGYMHLGHVVNALYVWGLARALGGRVRLRMEDHDRTRCRPVFDTAILDDLAWLGFEADEGHAPVDRQSDAGRAYADALARLAATSTVYRCRCSRRDIGGHRYDGRCRALALPDAPGLSTRVVLGPGEERALDGLLGPLVQTPDAQCGDLLVRDRHAQWTYQFAVTVDDLRQHITLVVRGADLASSTGRQVRLARLLGRGTAPVFVHHPLLAGPHGKKLSKRLGDAGIAELREAGYTPARVIGLAAAEVGLQPEPQPLAARDVARLFTDP